MHMTDQFNSTKHSHLSENQEDGGTGKHRQHLLFLPMVIHSESQGLSCPDFTFKLTGEAYYCC